MNSECKKLVLYVEANRLHIEYSIEVKNTDNTLYDVVIAYFDLNDNRAMVAGAYNASYFPDGVEYQTALNVLISIYKKYLSDIKNGFNYKIIDLFFEEFDDV